MFKLFADQIWKFKTLLPDGQVASMSQECSTTFVYTCSVWTRWRRWHVTGSQRLSMPPICHDTTGGSADSTRMPIQCSPNTNNKYWGKDVWRMEENASMLINVSTNETANDLNHHCRNSSLVQFCKKLKWSHWWTGRSPACWGWVTCCTCWWTTFGKYCSPSSDNTTFHIKDEWLAFFITYYSHRTLFWAKHALTNTCINFKCDLHEKISLIKFYYWRMWQTNTVNMQSLEYGLKQIINQNDVLTTN